MNVSPDKPGTGYKRTVFRVLRKPVNPVWTSNGGTKRPKPSIGSPLRAMGRSWDEFMHVSVGLSHRAGDEVLDARTAP